MARSIAFREALREAMTEEMRREMTHVVLINHEGQYAVWSASDPVPAGWEQTGFCGSRTAWRIPPGFSRRADPRQIIEIRPTKNAGAHR